MASILLVEPADLLAETPAPRFLPYGDDQTPEHHVCSCVLGVLGGIACACPLPDLLDGLRQVALHLQHPVDDQSRDLDRNVLLSNTIPDKKPVASETFSAIML